MSRVGVVDMAIETREGMAFLLVTVDSAATELSASFFAHDLVDVAWRGSLSFSKTKDPLIWLTRWNPDLGLPPLLEVENVAIGEPTLASLDPGPTRWVFLPKCQLASHAPNFRIGAWPQHRRYCPGPRGWST
jgi:hypothetical protein